MAEPTRLNPPVSAAGRFGLGHDGPCGIRELCWKPECLKEFRVYRTVERWPHTGLVIAYCHGSQFAVLGMKERAA